MYPRFPFSFPRGPGRGWDGGMMDWAPAVMAIVLIIVFLVCIAMWVLRSIALMRMARKLGFPDPWLAWIPGAGEYLFVKTAGDRQRRIGIAYMFVLYFGILAGLVITALGCIPAMMSGAAWSGRMYDGMWGMMGAAALGVIPGLVFLSLVLIAAMVLRLILMYHIFKRFKPDNAVVFLVLSIFFNFLGPIFLLVSSFGEPDQDSACCCTPPPPGSPAM